jgi:hypothetical protein
VRRLREHGDPIREAVPLDDLPCRFSDQGNRLAGEDLLCAEPGRHHREQARSRPHFEDDLLRRDDRPEPVLVGLVALVFVHHRHVPQRDELAQHPLRPELRGHPVGVDGHDLAAEFDGLYPVPRLQQAYRRLLQGLVVARIELQGLPVVGHGLLRFSEAVEGVAPDDPQPGELGGESDRLGQAVDRLLVPADIEVRQTGMEPGFGARPDPIGLLVARERILDAAQRLQAVPAGDPCRNRRRIELDRAVRGHDALGEHPELELAFCEAGPAGGIVGKPADVAFENSFRGLEVAGFAFAHADVEEDVGILRIGDVQFAQQRECARVIEYRGVHRCAQFLEIERAGVGQTERLAFGDGFGMAAVPEHLFQRVDGLHEWASYGARIRP